MPLSKTGKKIKKNFEKEYGKKGDKFFYAWENEKKHNAFIFKKVSRGENEKMTRGNAGRGSRGACGGTRRRDGSGKGVGNRGTSRQPRRRKKK